MMVERYPNIKEEVGGSIPGCEISVVLARIHAKWSTTSYAWALACRPFVPNKTKKWMKCNGHGRCSRLKPLYEFHFEGLSNFSASAVEGPVQIQVVNPRI